TVQFFVGFCLPNPIPSFEVPFPPIDANTYSSQTRRSTTNSQSYSATSKARPVVGNDRNNG
ncbi:hypothetical protein K443DRAFT_655097, partial [Laccaria amethystina LaAM-08-1]